MPIELTRAPHRYSHPRGAHFHAFSHRERNAKGKIVQQFPRCGWSRARALISVSIKPEIPICADFSAKSYDPSYLISRSKWSANAAFPAEENFSPKDEEADEEEKEERYTSSGGTETNRQGRRSRNNPPIGVISAR